MTTITLESINRPKAFRPPKAVSSARVVPFRTEPDPALYSDSVDLEDVHKSWTHVRIADAYAVTDPLEYFFYSVITGAAVISVLIGILSLPNMDPSKSEISKIGRSQVLETSLVIPNRS
jgi:hypothetical protein